MTKSAHALAWMAGAAMVLSLGGCGGRSDEAELAEATEAAGPGAMPGDPGGAGGSAGMANQAMTSYLAEGGADPNGRAFALDQVTFDAGSSTLDAADQQALGEVAAVLKQHPQAMVTITSHVESGGDPAAHKKLAAARAVSVKNAIAAAGATNRLMTNVVEPTGTGTIAPDRHVELLVKRS